MWELKNEVDTDNSGYIEFNEFCEMLQLNKSPGLFAVIRHMIASVPAEGLRRVSIFEVPKTLFDALRSVSDTFRCPEDVLNTSERTSISPVRGDRAVFWGGF